MCIFQASSIGLSSQPVKSNVADCTVHCCSMSVNYTHSQAGNVATILSDDSLFCLNLNDFDP